MENAQTLLALAQRETGLSDYGRDTFREGLERLVDALNNEARLNAVVSMCCATGCSAA